MQPRISPLVASDRADWEILARGYKDFYQTVVADSEYETAWRRLLREDGVFGIAARSGNQSQGIAHYLFHTGTWSPSVCYLQDLYVAPGVRGQGVARALIARVAEHSRNRGASRLYWLTQQDNATARALYDKVASFNGFLRYDFPL